MTDLEKKLLYTYSWPGNVRELESAAIHYNTLSKLPKYILNTLNVSPSKPNSVHSLHNNDIEMEILKIIMENTQLFHGIGRMELNTQLKYMKIYVGDASLRNVLQSLKEKELITINKC